MRGNHAIGDHDGISQSANPVEGTCTRSNFLEQGSALSSETKGTCTISNPENSDLYNPEGLPPITAAEFLDGLRQVEIYMRGL